MSINSRRLRHLVTIEQQVTQINSSGESDTDWEYVTTAWAAIEPLSTRESLLAQQVQSQVTAKIIIRYRSDIDASCRIRHNGLVYNITGVIVDPDSGLEWITLPVTAGLNEG